MMLLPIRAAAKWLVQAMSVGGYQPDNREMQQVMAGAVSVRSRIPFRPVFAAAEFQSLRMPILLLIGEKETMYEPRSALDNARSLIPGVVVELVPDAGHMLSTDQPERVAARISTFLGRRI
jgi:pimeloyl-ACP methyl ester carboxylesterase